jgi:hypothetical protein
MQIMMDAINLIGFKQIIWAVPTILLLHELEEWNIKKWHEKYFTNFPHETNLSLRMWLLFLSLIGFVWTTIAFLIPNNTISAIWMYLLIDFTLFNGLQHLGGLFKFKQFHNPGSFFAVLCGIPADIYITYRILIENLIPVWGIIVLLALIIPGIIETVKAGNKMSKIIYLASAFGIKLADFMNN